MARARLQVGSRAKGARHRALQHEAARRVLSSEIGESLSELPQQLPAWAWQACLIKTLARRPNHVA